MRIDRTRLDALAALPDDKLWSEVKAMAQGYGINMPEKPPSHSELEKLRSMCRGDIKFSISDAMKIIEGYRGGKRG